MMTASYAGHSLRTSTVCAVLAIGSIGFAKAAPVFDAWLVDTSNATQDPVIVDVDGDQLLDLVVPKYSRERGRELHIYKQTGNAKFSSTPINIEIKSEIIGFSMIDVREEPGAEIIWITADALYGMSTGKSGYVGNLEHLADWELFIRNPDSKELIYVSATDINRDGHKDLILPGPKRYGMFLSGTDQGLKLVGTFNVPTKKQKKSNDSKPRSFARAFDTRGIVDIDPRNNARVRLREFFAYESMYERLFAEVDRASRRTERVSFGEWQPGVMLLDVNGDGLSDVVMQTDNELAIHYQKSTYDFSPIQSVPRENSESLEDNLFILGGIRIPNPTFDDSSLEDVDGDGDLDIVTVDTGVASSSIRIAINDSGSFDMSKPTQAFRISGAVINVEFVALADDEKPSMLVNTFAVPLRKLLVEIELRRNALLFKTGGDKSLFAKRPVTESVTRINIDSFRNVMPSTLKYDLDMDGRNDLVQCSSDGSVTAVRIDALGRAEADPYWHYTPQYAVFSTHATDLNRDGTTDLELRHSNAVTYLISRQ